MVDEGKDIFCEKCGTKMVKEQYLPPRSLDMYSGSTNITHTSVATSVTVHSLGTNTASGTGPPYSTESYARPAIKIINYACPSCGWKTQIRL
jgi:hypothetical protein